MINNMIMDVQVILGGGMEFHITMVIVVAGITLVIYFGKKLRTIA